MAGLLPAISLIGQCHDNRDRRDKRGDDGRRRNQRCGGSCAYCTVVVVTVGARASCV
jgi:hypothetical protein